MPTIAPRALFATILLGTLVAAPAARAADPGVTDNEIVIGLFAPLSGALAAFGTDALNAAKLVYDEANAKGGVHGRKIRVIVEDDKCNPNEANAIAQKLVTVDNVFMLHGGSCTAAAAAIQSFVTRQKVPHVMLNASGDPALFPVTRYVFGGFGGTQGTVGSGMMQFAIDKLKAKSVAYISSDDDYGTSNYGGTKAAADKAGVKIATYERIPNTITDVTATMLRVKQSNPDVIISAAYPQGAVLIAQARSSYGMSQPLVQATQGVTSPAAFATNVGDAAALKDFYYSDVIVDQPDSTRLKPIYDKYRAAFPDRKIVATYMVMGIASAQAVVNALDKAGRDLTRETFVNALEDLNFESGVFSGPVAFSAQRHDAVRSTNILKFDGKDLSIAGTYFWDGSRAQ
jgi:branched-chain amino acid transport system substrate-binding protein